MKTLILLACAIPACAGITNVRLTGATTTQAVVVYTASDASVCTIEVSEAEGYAPLVHDVNPALFANANRDDREGNLSSGRERTFVIGKRAAERAGDGRYYSRALQAYTTHYFRISCGADVATGAFRTANIPLNATYNDPLPADPNNTGYHGAGNYAWPTVTGADAESVIDPLTGALLKRFSKMPGARSYPSYGFSVLEEVANPSGNWGNAAPAVLTGNDSNYATYAAANRDALLVIPDSTKMVSYSPYLFGLDYVTVNVIGWGAAADPQNRALQVCMTLDRATCYGDWIDIPLPASDPGSVAASTAATPYLMNWISGKQPPAMSDMQKRSAGTVTVSGATVTASASESFVPVWGAGSRLTITGGTGCPVGTYTVAALIDDRTLQLTSSPGDAAGCSWSAFNFGFLMRKKTATSDQITIDQITFTSKVTRQGEWSSAGSEDVCFWVQSFRAGVPGYNCVERTTGALYWMSAVDGSRRLLGSATLGMGTLGLSFAVFGGSSLDPTHPGTFYGLTSERATGKVVIAKWSYTGDNTQDIATTNDGEDGGLYPSNASVANVTPSPRDLYTLLTEYTAASPTGSVFSSAKYGCDIAGVQSANAIVLRCLMIGGGQDVAGWVVVFDAVKVDAAAGCVGGGAPGCVVAAIDTFGRTNSANGVSNRWCGLHYAFGQGDDNWTLVSPVHGGTISTGKGGGPWATTVSAPVEIGATTIVANGEPADPNPAAGETGGPGEYGKIAPGDLVCLSNINPATDPAGACGGDNHELALVTGKTEDPAPGNPQTLTVTRGLDGAGTRRWTGAVYLTMACGARTISDKNSLEKKFWWNWAADPHGLNATGSLIRADRYIGSHSAYKTGYYVDSGSYNVSGEGHQARVGALPGAIDQPMTGFTQYYSPFAGSVGLSAAGYIVETHPNWSQTEGGEAEKAWFLDMRPILAGAGGTRTPTEHTGSLYTYTAAGVENVKRAPLFGRCGYQPLRDISGPAQGNVIATDTSTAYTYCIPQAAGECRTGSTVGKIYINCPYSTANTQISFGGMLQAMQGMRQISVDRANTSRTVTYAMSRYFRFYGPQGFEYWSARALPNGGWAIVRTPWLNGLKTEWISVKLPPWTDGDSVNRTSYTPIAVKAGSVPAGTSTAAAEFGYDADFHCTSRQEACVAAGTGQVNETTPFYWASEAYSGLACADGCEIAIPAIPQRVVYYRLTYRKADGSAITTGATQIAVVQ